MPPGYLDLGLQLAAALQDGLERLAGVGMVEGQALVDGTGLVDSSGGPAGRLQADVQRLEEAVAVGPLVLDVVAVRLADGVDRRVRVDRLASGVETLGVLADVLVDLSEAVGPHEAVALLEREGRGDVDAVLAVELVGMGEGEQLLGADCRHVDVLPRVYVNSHLEPPLLPFERRGAAARLDLLHAVKREEVARDGHGPVRAVDGAALGAHVQHYGLRTGEARLDADEAPVETLVNVQLEPAGACT